jgi:hypothetical protein
MRARFLVASFAIAAVLATPVSAAAQVELRITAGRVWLKAVNATVGQILNEWSRLGQTTIVNGDRVPGGPVTLQLDNVSEEEALNVILKSAAGFMGVRRTTPVAANSEFDRIQILPRSTVVASAQPAATSPPPTPVFAQPEPPPSFTPGVQRVLDAQGQPVPDDQDDGPPQPRQVPAPAAPYSPEAPFGQPPAPPVGSPTPGQPVGVPVPGMTTPAPRPQPQNPPDGP